MGNKKDIGSIFREKLENLDASPNDSGWAAIHDELDKKEKKRRLLPIWFWYVGLFSAGILITVLVYTNSNSKNNLQNIEAADSKNLKTDSDKNSITSNGTFDDNETNITTDAKENSEEVISNENSDETKKSVKTVNNTIVVGKKNNENTSKTDKSFHTNSNTVTKNRKTIASEKTISYAFKSKSRNKAASKEKIKSKSNSAKSNSAKDKNDAFLSKSKTENSEILKNFEEKGTQQNSKLDENEIKNELQNSIIESKQQIAKEKSIVKDSIKKKKNLAEKPKDSVSTKEPNNQVYTVFVYGSPTAIVFANNNSLLDNLLNSNSKTSKLTLSYGAYLCFEGSKNFSIRNWNWKK